MAVNDSMAANNSMTENEPVIDPFYINVYDWTKRGMSTYVSLSFFLGIPGNSLVVLVHRRIKEKSVTDWMIFYLAVCDIMSLINAPFYVFQWHGYWARGGAPDFFCKYHYFNLNSVSVAAYLFCSCMAIERYYKVVASKSIFSRTFVKYMWIPIFLVSFGIGTVVIFAVANNPNGHCMFDLTGTIATIEYAILLFVAFTTTLIMTTSYIRIGIFLMKKMKELNQSGPGSGFSKSYRNTVQTTKMLSVVTIVFLFSSNTPHLTGVVFTIDQPTQEPAMTVMTVFALMFFINNFVNPFLYLGMSVSFQRRTRSLISSCCGSKYSTSGELSDNKS